MSFYRTDEFLESDNFRRWFLRAGVLVAVFGLWLTWFLVAEISLVAKSDLARLESARSVHTVEAPVSGSISVARVSLGQSVVSGELLVELESEEQRFELREAESRLAARRSELEHILSELGIESERLQAERLSADQEAAEARTRAEVDEVEARYARSELEQLSPLHDAGLLSLRERLELEAEAQRTQTEAEAERQGLESLEAEQKTVDKAIEAQIARLRREAAITTGEIEDLAAHVEHLRHEMDERSLRAPVDGVLGWVSNQQVGSFVAAGQRLAEIVPEGELRAVAFFPVSALGRLRPGQPARMRLDAYPWAQFGVLSGEVERVATEPEAGRIRAELTVAAEPSSRILLEHGLTGQVEVETEAISPALLVLRAAGDTFRSRDRSAVAATAGVG